MIARALELEMAKNEGTPRHAMIGKNGPILIIGGDKGGVGKSMLGRVGAAWLRKRGYSIVGFDGDARNAHLDRYCSATIEVKRTTLRHEQGWAFLFSGWEETRSNAVVLVDLPGNIGDSVERQMERIQRVAAALDRRLIHIWVCDEEEDSVTLFGRLRGLAPPTQTLVVLNGRFCSTPREFHLWHESELRADFIAEGGRETFLPALPIRTRTKIARAHAPFDDLSSASLSAWEQVDFDMWWEKVEITFNPLTAIIRGLP